MTSPVAIPPLDCCGRGDTPDEMGVVGALLMGPDGAFITGSDFLMEAASRLLTGSENSLRSDQKRGLILRSTKSTTGIPCPCRSNSIAK